MRSGDATHSLLTAIPNPVAQNLELRVLQGQLKCPVPQANVMERGPPVEATAVTITPKGESATPDIDIPDTDTRTRMSGYKPMGGRQHGCLSWRALFSPFNLNSMRP